MELRAYLGRRLGRRARGEGEPPLDIEVDDAVGRLPTGAGEYRRRDPGTIRAAVIHHSAAAGDLPVEALAAYHVQRRCWPGIGYHYYLTADGTIHRCNRLEAVSWHCGSENPRSVGICLAGDFTDPGARPTDSQLASARGLIAALEGALDRRLEVWGHKELAPTACPGAGWPDVRRYSQRGWRRYVA